MTLIAATIDRHGIVLATDSNLTAADKIEREGRKNFELPHIRAGLTISGGYAVDGVPMDKWMPQFIASEGTYEKKTLAGFVNCLRIAVDCEMRADEKQNVSLLHVAGYERDERGFHPEFYSVTNAGDIDGRDGDYIHLADTFSAKETFWNRDCRHKESQTGFPVDSDGQFQFYVDGFPHARMACMEVLIALNPFFTRLWGNNRLSYHPPQSIQESLIFMRLLMTIMTNLFKISHYKTLYVGGEIQIIGIPFPGASINRP